MKKISATIAITIITMLVVIVAIAEFYLGNIEHGSIYLDPYKKTMNEKLKNIDDRNELVSHIYKSIDNQPFIYRQALFLSIFGTLLAIAFLSLIIPSFEEKLFFPLFFVLFFIFFLELAFLHFHYYQQKEDMVKIALDKLKKFDM